jgi:hypothetical protein
MTTLIPKFDLKDGGATPAGAVNRPINEKLAEAVSVLDFGAVGNGVANDAPAFQAAIDSGAKYIVIPAPTTSYLLTTSLNMTGLRGITFDFQASLDINIPQIVAKHTNAVFDLTGAFDCCFINPNVKGDATTTPTCLFLLARNSTGASASRHRFFNVRANGNFSTAIVYNYGCEEDEWYSPLLIQNQAVKSCVYITSTNSASLTSAFATIATGAQSTVCHRFYGGSYYSQGNSGSTNETCFVFNGIADISIDGAFMYCPNGISLIYSNSATSQSDVVSITNCRGEISGSLPTYSVYYSAGTQTYAAWRIVGNRFASDSYDVYGENGITFNNFTYDGNVSTNAYGISGQIIEYSYIRHESSYAQSRASGNYNVWIGSAANRTATGQAATFINTDTNSFATSTLITTQINATQSNYLIPTTDNTVDFGQSSARWKVIYAGTGTINTSDGREKQQIRQLNQAEKEAAQGIKLALKAFKFNDAVTLKGNKARIHFGVIAQEVKEIFAVVGLDANDYGMFCSDTLEDGSTRLGVRYDELLAFVISAL